MGAFDLFAWQFLWVLGLWFGALGIGHTRRMLASSRRALHLALAVSCALFAWRYLSGPAGFADPVRHLLWVDKWTLSPVRVVNIAALVFLVVGALGRALPRKPLLAPLELLGGASQWVFVAHIASALLLLCLVGQDDQPLGGAQGAMVLAIGILTLFLAGLAYRLRRRRLPAAAATPLAPGDGQTSDTCSR